jgi:hypothetical protein
VPGGRVLNPQSYHSAFRISSTRHEKAAAVQQLSMTLISPEAKNKELQELQNTEKSDSS